MANNWTAVTNATGLLQVANTNTGGWFWTGILFMIFAILFLSMLGIGFVPALLGAAFACMLIGIILTYMGLVAWYWTLTFVGILVALFLWIMFQQRDY